jgi:hypothetical protein
MWLAIASINSRRSSSASATWRCAPLGMVIFRLSSRLPDPSPTSRSHAQLRKRMHSHHLIIRLFAMSTAMTSTAFHAGSTLPLRGGSRVCWRLHTGADQSGDFAQRNISSGLLAGFCAESRTWRSGQVLVSWAIARIRSGSCPAHGFDWAVWGTGGGRREVCRRRQGSLASQDRMRDSHHHVVRSGVPQMGLCAASAVGSGVTWWGMQGILELQWKLERQMLTEGMLESGCTGSIHPAQTVIHGHYITRTLYVCRSIPRAGYNCPALTLPARISSSMLRNIHSVDCRVQHLLYLS